MNYIILLAIAYLLGSVPFALIITKWFSKQDLRNVGSGNIGATNVMRVGGLKLAGLVLILDMVKAMIPVFLGVYIGGEAFGALCGLFAIIGHCFPVWLGFKGGKGNSSLFGMILALNPIVFIIMGIEWLFVAFTTGYSSLAAIVGFILLPIFGFTMNCNVGIVFIFVSILCFWTHRSNIKRLFKGEESKIKWKWKK